MKKIKIIIDGREVLCQEGESVMAVARRNGFDIPGLCHHPDLDVKANCRLCAVEIEGARGLAMSCHKEVADGMKITTSSPRIERARNVNLELIFAEHVEKCGTCVWRVNCRLLDLAMKYKVKITRFRDRKAGRKIHKFGASVEIDGTQCIDCRNCIDACANIQKINYLRLGGRGAEQEIVPAKDGKAACIHCGQCALHCPVGSAQEQSEWEKVESALGDKNLTLVAQFSPIVGVSAGEEFGLEPGSEVFGRLAAALRALGFAYVYNLEEFAPLAAAAEAGELLKAKDANKILISSACPAWKKYIEHYAPELKGNLAVSRPPSILAGEMIKKKISQEKNIDVNNIIVVSIVPCTAQKDEARAYASLFNDFDPIDQVLTIREFAWLAKKNNIVFNDLPASQSDVFGVKEKNNFSGLYDASGGQTAAVLDALAGGEREQGDFKELFTAAHLKETEVNFGGRKIKALVLNGVGSARAALKKIGSFDYLEGRACPEGCLGGGGQAAPSDTDKIKERKKSLLKYYIDPTDGKNMKQRKKRVGIFSFSCDEGCSIYLVEIFNKKLLPWLEKIELAYFLSVKDHTDIKDIDVAVVEGVVTTEEDKKKIEHLRKNCKVVIGMGNCAITGLPSCQRNSFSAKQLAEIQPDLEKFKFLPKCLAIKQAIKLDDEVPGCPMDEKKFIEVFEKYL